MYDQTQLPFDGRSIFSSLVSSLLLILALIVASVEAWKLLMVYGKCGLEIP